MIAAIFAPYLRTIGEGERDVRRIAIAEGRQLDSTGYLQPPSSEWWFGTSSAGQDMWSRVIYGARPALIIGVGSVAIAMVAAIVLALAMGFLRGWVDTVLLRILEAGIAVPGLLWLILFTTAIERSLPIIVVAIALAFAPLTALVLRGNVLQEASTAYVEAARVIGASNARIMLRHILPNLLPLAIVNASIIVPAAIMAEAGLAFLGFGLPRRRPPGASTSARARGRTSIRRGGCRYSRAWRFSLTVLGVQLPRRHAAGHARPATARQRLDLKEACRAALPLLDSDRGDAAGSREGATGVSCHAQRGASRSLFQAIWRNAWTQC